MWTIIKSVLRFFKSSKLSMIGLFLLIFFSSAIFTLLNNTTINLQRSYENISKNGNLHDFVINEHFSLGYANYEAKQIAKNTTNENNQDGTVTTKYFLTYQFYPSGSIYTNSTNIDYSNIDWTNSYLNVYNKEKNNENYFNTYVNFQNIFDVSKEDYDYYSNNNELPSYVLNYINTKKVDLTEYTNLEIVKIFDDVLLNELKLPIEFRRFRSLDVNNTQQKIFFKVVESRPEYTIDKVVYYSGNQLSSSTNLYNYFFGELSPNMITNNATDQEKEIVNKKTRSLVDYIARSKWTQVNTSNQFINFNNYIKNNDNNFNPYFSTITNTNNSQLDTQLKNAQTKLKEFVNSVLQPNYSGTYSVTDKAYQIRFSFDDLGIPVTGYIDDFTSYQMVISPYYAQTLNKTPINIDEWTNHQGDSQDEFIQYIRGLPDDNKIKVDEIEYVVVGTGVSPDFMYPILTFENLVPNKEKEQVVYANANGYEKIYDAFRGNNTENFVVGKFANDLSKTEQSQIIDTINDVSRLYMSWPANINAAYFFDSTDNTLTPSSLRVQFIPQTVQVTNVVSLFMTSFVILLSIFVSIIIIKRFIESNRNSLGIMQASGYRKREIITAMNFLISLPTILASVLGYILGFLLQSTAIQILGNFWTIPTSFASFSFVYLIIIVIGLSALFILVSTLFALLSLRGETSEFMKDDAKYKMSRISRIMKFPFMKFNIIVRFRAAIAFSSIWRLLVLSVMSALLMLSLTFSFAVLNKYDAAAKDSFAPRNYIYQMNLITPTVQGGQYYAVPYDYQGMTLKNNVYFNKTTYDNNDIENNPQNYNYVGYQNGAYANAAKDPNLLRYMNVLGNYQLVSMNDNTDLNTQILYTKNKTSSKAFIDHYLGFGNLSTNPWALAESMMPPNNANYANKHYNDLFKNAYNDKTSKLVIKLNNETTASEHTYAEAVTYFTKESDGNSSSSFLDGGYKLEIDENGAQIQVPTYREFDKTKTAGLASLKSEFLTFLYDLYSNPKYKNDLYSINYNKLVINPTDEPYTYLDFNIKNINGENRDIIDNLSAIGISQNSLRLDLKDTEGNNLNQRLMETNYYPIIINEFAKKKYSLNIGDKIDVEVSNSVDRYSRSLHGVSTKVTATFTIVGIASTYQGSEFFVSQYDANKILGLEINNFKAITPTSPDMITNTVQYDLKQERSLPTKEEFITNRSGFNGIFTLDPNSLVEITNGVSLYSTSGLYPGIDKFSITPTLTRIIEYSKNGVNNKQIISSILGSADIANKSTNEIIQQISQIFGESTQFTIVSEATSRNALLSVFTSVTNTTSNIQNVVLSIIIIVSLIIVVIISGIIINDSIKLAAILKCLGLRDSKNAMTFLAVYFPVLLLGLLIAVPFSYLINNIYVNVIFNFAGILLTIPMVWWHYILSTFAIIIIFLLSYWIAWFKIHYMNLPKAIK